MNPRRNILLASLCFVLILGHTAQAASPKPNVLFIAVDDLRPQLGCYGERQMHTPNIDRLAQQGTVFERAYCMVSVCGASRASLMTGIRPTRTRFVDHLTYAQKDAPGIMTLNTHFKNQGYFTLSNGKVFHHADDNAQGWSEPAWWPSGAPFYAVAESEALHKQRMQESNKKKRGPPYESVNVADNAYADGRITDKSIKDLRRLAKLDQPFFLAVGFFKPHLPFVAPRKYWDLYSADQIPPPASYHLPQNAPAQAIHPSGELRAYTDIPATGPVSDEMARKLIHGYYACVSYTDAQVGKLLDELDQLGLADNTIVVLWGDHGWNLGEHTLWCKHSCFETSMHAPLIVKAPGIAGEKKTRGLTEFIDIYPSLCELAGLPLPDHLQGRSFVPLLNEPDQKWKATAIGRFGNGDTIRTDQFRLSEYTDAKGKVVARMLYDHQADPAEDTNIVQQKNQKETVADLTRQLQEGKGK